RLIDFRGYAYTRTPSEISGALMTRYDETTPEVWRIPLRDTLAPSVTVDLPAAGYLVPAAHAARVSALLDLHGVAYRRLADALPAQAVEVFRADAVELSAMSVEGHTRMTPAGTWAAEEQALAAGALFVPVAQAKARVVVSLFEPMAP